MSILELAMNMLLSLILFVAPLDGGEPDVPITPDRIQEQAKAIMPLVEKHAARKFKEPPAIRFVDSLEMVDLLIKDIDFVRELLKVEEEETLDQLIDSVSDSLSLVFRAAPSFAGKYVLHKKEIVISPETITTIAEERSWPPSTRDDFIKLVLAHELVHALSDQVVGYEQAIGRVADSKQKQWLFPTVNEGIACVLTHRMKKDLGIDKNFDELEQVYTNNPLFGQHYVMGRETMEKVLDRFGTDGLWATLANPFAYDPGDGKDVSTSLYKEALLSDPVKRIMKCGAAEFIEAPPEMGMQLFRMMDPRIVKELRDGLKRVCTAACMKRESPASAVVSSVTIYVAENEQAAKAVYEAVGEAVDKAIGAVGFLVWLEPSSVQENSLASGTQFRWRRSDTKQGQKHPMNQYMAWLLVSHQVVTVHTVNATPTQDEVVDILQTLEQRLSGPQDE